MSDPLSCKASGLTEAFRVFNQLSDQLSRSYHSLEERVGRLDHELAQARSARLAELSEKERLANRLQALLASLPAGVLVVDAGGRIQECNPVAEDLLGRPLLGEAWQTVIERAFAPRADDGADISLRDGRRVSLSTCPLGAEPGQILLLKDVSETRLLQDRLAQHGRLATMGEMAASLAHQIRTPLSASLLYASQLKRSALPEAERGRMAGKLIGGLRELESLVDDMLLYARSGTAGEEQFDAAGLLADVSTAIAEQVQRTGTRFRCAGADVPVQLWGNRRMLASALQNLAENAMQAMGRGGRLRLAARADAAAGTLELSVSDDGPGIAAEHQERVFTPFFTTRASGTGLGLAVVAGVVRAHRGDIRLESAAGEGCTFRVLLPARVAEARGPVQREEVAYD